MEWISINSDLPNKDAIVPVISQGHIFYGQYLGDRWIFIMHSNVFQLALIQGLPEFGDPIYVTHWIGLSMNPYDGKTEFVKY